MRAPKNFQLDLFTPDDGHFEYYAVATNMPLDLPALYAFICGRGAQEKTIAELKGEFALDVGPDPALRRQQCVAAAQCPRAQPHPELPARYPRAAQTAVPETHLCVPHPKHADSALPAHCPRRPAEPASVAATSYACPTAPPPRPSMRPLITAWPPELFADWAKSALSKRTAGPIGGSSETPGGPFSPSSA